MGPVGRAARDASCALTLRCQPELGLRACEAGKVLRCGTSSSSYCCRLFRWDHCCVGSARAQRRCLRRRLGASRCDCMTVLMSSKMGCCGSCYCGVGRRKGCVVCPWVLRGLSVRVVFRSLLVKAYTPRARGAIGTTAWERRWRSGRRHVGNVGGRSIFTNQTNRVS